MNIIDRGIYLTLTTTTLASHLFFLDILAHLIIDMISVSEISVTFTTELSKIKRTQQRVLKPEQKRKTQLSNLNHRDERQT